MDKARGEVLQKAEIDVGINQIDELQSHLLGQGPQGRLLTQESKLHGGLVQPHPVGLSGAGLRELLGIQQAFSEKHFANVHGSHHSSRKEPCPG